MDEMGQVRGRPRSYGQDIRSVPNRILKNFWEEGATQEELDGSIGCVCEVYEWAVS